MKRLLIDVNLILDVLQDRRPHAAAASQVWSAVESGKAEGLISAHALTTIHYLNAREVGAAEARKTPSPPWRLAAPAATPSLPATSGISLARG